MNAPNESAAGPVLLFDGECGLCNRVVRGLLRLDGEERLKFAALQSVPAQEFLRVQRLPVDDFDTLVFVPDWSRRLEARAFFFLRTAGAIAALRQCGGTGRLLADGLAIFPAPLRDAGYRRVARIRYRIFGEWRASPLPRPEWAARFLA
jgi:predicted DCC family thiol-disulfide oxidoreductase YuxK